MNQKDIKENLIKARFIVIGLILITLPHSLEQFKFMLNLFEKHNFWSGLATGVLIGVKIIGLCLFAYGIAFYVKKHDNISRNKKVKGGNDERKGYGDFERVGHSGVERR